MWTGYSLADCIIKVRSEDAGDSLLTTFVMKIAHDDDDDDNDDMYVLDKCFF